MYCKNNCKEFSGRVLDNNTKHPIEGLTILVDEHTSGKNKNLGYFTTNAQGIFTTKVTATNFDVSYIIISVYLYNHYTNYEIGSMHGYADTITNFYY